MLAWLRAWHGCAAHRNVIRLDVRHELLRVKRNVHHISPVWKFSGEVASTHMTTPYFVSVVPRREGPCGLHTMSPCLLNILHTMLAFLSANTESFSDLGVFRDTCSLATCSAADRVQACGTNKARPRDRVGVEVSIRRISGFQLPCGHELTQPTTVLLLRWWSATTRFFGV